MLDAVVVNVYAGVRIEKEQVHPVEPDAIHLGPGGEIEHGVQVNARLGTGAALADQAGPHGIVKFWVVAPAVLRAHNVLGLESLTRPCS